MIASASVMGVVGLDVPAQVILLGVISGLIYGLLGVGLALLYKATRVINFAHAEVGALAAAVMAVLHVVNGLPYLVALAAALLVAVGVNVLVERVVIRRLEHSPRLVVMVATIGVSQVLLAANAFLPRDELQLSSFPVPFRSSATVFDLRLQTGELLVLGAVPALAVSVGLFWRRSRLGLGARAAAENMEAARVFGVPQRKVSMAVWALAGILSVASAVLYAPTQTTAAPLTVGSALLIRALAAAVLGGVSNLGQVAAAGVAVGVLETVVAWNYPTSGALDLVLLGMILVSVFFRRDLDDRGRGGEESSWSLGGVVRSLPPHLLADPRVRRMRAIVPVALAAVAIVAPLPLESGQRVLLASIAIYVIMGLSLTVLTGYTGQVSLGQFAFVSLGAVLAGRLHQLGYISWVGLLYTVCIGGAVAVVVGLPALRMRGLFLAVTTMAFGVAAQSWVPRQRWLVSVTGGETSLQLPRPRWFGVDLQDERNYYWFCLLAAVAVALVVSRMRRTGLGRSLTAVRDNEVAAATLSISPRRAKLTGFVLSGMVASLGGWLYAGLLVNYTGVTLFAPADSLALIAMVVFGGVTSVTGAVLGALWLRGIPYFLGTNWGILASGIGLLVVLLFLPGGLAELVTRWRDRLAAAVAGDQGAPSAAVAGSAVPARRPLPAAVPSDGVAPLGDPLPLTADDVVVRFGGVVAVDGVSMEARQGEIIGLLGPNGAGKTTLFDVLSGQLRPTRGRVLIGGADVTHLRPEERALLGLGRSFQQARLFPEMPLREAFELALEPTSPSEVLPSLLGLPASFKAERDKQMRAEELLELLGLSSFATKNCGELSTGTRRFAELGLMVAMDSSVVLLDEPMAGIAQREVEAFTPVIREIRDHLDATMVIIDHDIPMMVGLVDRLYVMAAGTMIAEGPPSLIREDPAVIAAYLGTDERAISRSGDIAAPVPARPRRSAPLVARGSS